MTSEPKWYALSASLPFTDFLSLISLKELLSIDKDEEKQQIKSNCQRDLF